MFYILDLPTNPGKSDLGRRKLWFETSERTFYYQAIGGGGGSSTIQATAEDENTLRTMAQGFERNAACPGLLTKSLVAELSDALVKLGAIYSGVISFEDDLPR